MAGSADIKFYKSANGGNGGAISGQIVSDIPGRDNNVFAGATQGQATDGSNNYRCIYIKNTHLSEEIRNVSFWLTHDSGVGYGDTFTKWGLGTSGKNGVEQTIENKGDEPNGITWISLTNMPSDPNVTTALLPGQFYPLWIWRHIEPGATAREDDSPLFAFAFDITSGGTGSGGTADLDDFDIIKIYNTKTGGRIWNSTWDNGHARNWTGNGISNRVVDPDDDDSALICSNTGEAIAVNGTGIATLSGGNPRLYINDLDKLLKWQNVEMTVYYRAVSDVTNSIHVHCRLAARTEHQDQFKCCASGHTAGAFEIRRSASTVLRKELLHDSYANDVESTVYHDAPYTTWIGMKCIVKNVGNPVTAVKIEGWVDLTDGLNGGTWNKVVEKLDSRNWPMTSQEELDAFDSIPSGGTGTCKRVATNTSISPEAQSSCYLRADGTVVDYKKFSIREIDPTDTGGTTTPPPPDTGGETGGNPPPTTTNWKMAVAGDWGCGSTTDKVHNLAKTYDFILGVGDNAYASASCWTSTFNDVKSKMNSAYGNHEYSESGGISPYKTFFGHSKTYLSFNFHNVHVIVIDSNINMDSGSAQNTFVTNDIVAADNNSAIDWIFVTWHHPMFGASSSHSYNNGNCVQAFHSLLTQHKTAFVFTGHNHNWQRTHQVGYNSSSPTNPTVKDNTSPYVLSNQGLIHVVTGTGGHDSGGSLYSLGSQPSFQAYQNRTNNGIFEIVASNNAKTLTCSFVNTDGSKFDKFVITTA